MVQPWAGMARMDECLVHLGALPVAMGPMGPMGPMAYLGRLGHGTADVRRARARTVQVLWRSFWGGVQMWRWVRWKWCWDLCLKIGGGNLDWPQRRWKTWPQMGFQGQLARCWSCCAGGTLVQPFSSTMPPSTPRASGAIGWLPFPF